MHPMAPWTDVTFAGVYWREAERLPALLELVRPWFTHIVLGVQESPDDTLAIAKQYADTVIEDRCHGFAEPTFTPLLAAVKTPWVFIVSGDETPSEDLLESFQDMIEAAIRDPQIDAFGIRFRSTIEGIDFSAETDEHVRVFRPYLRWPTTMHSGPQFRRAVSWKTGSIAHDRSLTEMIHDYVRYYGLGSTDHGWTLHNAMMMREACRGVARHRGWEYVEQFDWWPEVQRIAFGGDDPRASTQ